MDMGGWQPSDPYVVVKLFDNYELAKAAENLLQKRHVNGVASNLGSGQEEDKSVIFPPLPGNTWKSRIVEDSMAPKWAAAQKQGKEGHWVRSEDGCKMVGMDLTACVLVEVWDCDYGKDSSVDELIGTVILKAADFATARGKLSADELAAAVPEGVHLQRHSSCWVGVVPHCSFNLNAIVFHPTIRILNSHMIDHLSPPSRARFCLRGNAQAATKVA